MLLTAVFAVGAHAQSTATLSGTVTDPSGAVVPGAQVIVHSMATNLDRQIVTDGAGLYVAASLQPGDYKVTATAAGFSKDTVDKVTLDVDMKITVNLKLPLASTGATVEVQSAAASQIEASTITVGQVIDRNTVQELPLNGRHFLDLTVLTPGGVVADTAGSLTAPSRGLGANSFITAGGREDSVNFQINGINLNDISQGQITFQPSISTTSEFKINNQTFSAEYGRSDGSIVTVATRSGSDKFHGEVFDYFRNEALDARNYFNRPFNPTTGLALVGSTGDKAPLKRNNFGFSVGGPIWRGHTFFFGSYEGLRQHQGILQNSTVFSQTQQQAFAANAANEPIAAALAALVPMPNSGLSSYVSFTPGPVQIDQYTGDVLHQINANDSLHGFYAFQKDVRTEPALQGDSIPGWGDHRNAHRQILTLSETHIFSPATVNEARLGFNRIAIAFNPANLVSPASVGLVDGLTGNVGLPQISFGDSNLVFGGPSGFPQGRTDTTGVLSDTLTTLKGKHTIKYGGEFRRYLAASFADNIGTLSFTSTSNNFANDNATGFTVQPNTVSSRVYADSLGVFVQDNYKVVQGLTLEYGLRFEWNGTPVEGANRYALFNPAGSGGATLTRVGTNGLAANAAYKQNYNFEPRLGFAYDVFGNGKTVIRSGYAYLVDQPVSGIVSAANPPFSTAVSYTTSGAIPNIPLNNLYNSAAAAGIAITATNPNFKNAYIESYNLNVQQALPWGMVSSLGYYGSVGRHLLVETNLNQPVGATSVTQVRPIAALSATSPIDPGKSVANVNIADHNSIGISSYNGMWAVLSKNMHNGFEFNMNYTWTKSMDLNSLGSQGGFVLPDSNNPGENYGLSDFDVRQHYAGTAIYALPFKGNRLVSGYQLSTIIQYQTGNPINITAASSNFNGITGLVRPNLVGKVVTAKQQVAGLSNVTFIQSPGTTGYGGTVCNTTNYTSACTYEIQSTQAVGPTCPVATNAATSGVGGCLLTTYTGLGSIQRNAVTGPGFADVDLSGEKDTKIFEGLTFKLRVDAFDILNHPNFGQPSGNVNSATFGQITSTRFATSDGGSSRQLQLSGKFIF
jgi:hypothetical protein